VITKSAVRGNGHEIRWLQRLYATCERGTELRGILGVTRLDAGRDAVLAGWCVTYCDKLCQTLCRRRRLMPANLLSRGRNIQRRVSRVSMCTLRLCEHDSPSPLLPLSLSLSLSLGHRSGARIIITRARPCHLVSHVDEPLLKRAARHAILTTTG